MKMYNIWYVNIICQIKKKMFAQSKPSAFKDPLNAIPVEFNEQIFSKVHLTS